MSITFHGKQPSQFKFPSMAKKKSVLSNKQLTKQIRSLKRNQGSRQHSQNNTFQAVALVAGTADINALTIPGTADHTVHYIDYYFKASSATAGGATLRLVFLVDEENDGVALTGAEILKTATDSVSPLNSTYCLPVAEARHPNRVYDARGVVYYDKLIHLNQNEPKTWRARIRLGRKVRSVNNDQLNMYMLALADEANVTFDGYCNYVYTVDNS